MQKHILILEEQGISRIDFEEIAKNLPYQLVWFDNEVIYPEKIEGIITVKTKVDAELLSTFQNIKFIAVAFTGFDCVDPDICKERNISVYNVPAYSTNSVAELAVALAISVLRDIPNGDKITKGGSWMMQPGSELAGKTVGILGTGTIGMQTARIFKAIGCNIIGYSRTEREEFKDLGIYVTCMYEFMTMADVISIHIPLNKETNGLIADEELDAMKESAILINTARGPIIEEKELIRVLKEKKIAGAGIDVFEQEPIDPENELLKLDNIIVTPHIAFKTKEALQRRAEIAVSNIQGFVDGAEINRVI